MKKILLSTLFLFGMMGIGHAQNPTLVRGTNLVDVVGGPTGNVYVPTNFVGRTIGNGAMTIGFSNTSGIFVTNPFAKVVLNGESNVVITVSGEFSSNQWAGFMTLIKGNGGTTNFAFFGSQGASTNANGNIYNGNVTWGYNRAAQQGGFEGADSSYYIYNIETDFRGNTANATNVFENYKLIKVPGMSVVRHDFETINKTNGWRDTPLSWGSVQDANLVSLGQTGPGTFVPQLAMTMQGTNFLIIRPLNDGSGRYRVNLTQRGDFTMDSGSSADFAGSFSARGYCIWRSGAFWTINRQVKAVSYSETDGDLYLGFRSNALATCTLQNANADSGRLVMIKDENGVAGVNILAQAGQTIGGSTNFLLPPGGGAIVVSDGSTNWNPIATSFGSTQFRQETTVKSNAKIWNGTVVVAGGAGQSIVNPTNASGTPFFNNIYSVQASIHDVTATAVAGGFTWVSSYGVNGTNIVLVSARGTTLGALGDSTVFVANGITNRVTIIGD